MKFFKYHGAGNDFLLADNRNSAVALSSGDVRRLCDRHTGFGADGLMLLESCPGFDFRMAYWNPDGSTGMMCGNGGRCIVAFANDLGLRSFRFSAPDGPHEGTVLSKEGNVTMVRLSMKDVAECRRMEEGGFFLDTGTRHYVRFTDDVEKIDIRQEGSQWRHDPRFSPQGTNVNFVSADGDGIKIRTFEKGVEDETLACGTGIVASAIASYAYGKVGVHSPAGAVRVRVHARIAELYVSFIPLGDGSFSSVLLEGPAEKVGEVISEII